MSTPIPAIDSIGRIQGILQAAGYTTIVKDGDIGPRTKAALQDLGDRQKSSVIVRIQDEMGKAGLKIGMSGIYDVPTKRGIIELDEMGDKESALSHPEQDSHHFGNASFFAGPQDVRAFKACKGRGGSDLHCFASGDNGVGLWGRDCTSQVKPLVALPREVWRNAGKTGGSKVWVEYDGKRVEGELGDTLPSLDNIHNGVMIDLNPAYAIEFGIEPEEMNSHTLSGVRWDWI